MGHVADRYCVLLLDVCEKRPAVVDLEVEDAVLIRQLEGNSVGGRIGRRVRRVRAEADAVERGQHAELELEVVAGGDGEGGPLVPGVFGQGDGVGL